MTAVGTTSGPHAAPGAARLVPGFQLGEYRLGQPLWPLRIADAYKADGPRGPATIYVLHAHVAANPAVRDHVIAGTRAAAALPEHKHLVRTLAAGLTGDVLWIATEEIDGALVRDMLAKKRLGSGRAGNAGLGTRATGNLITGIAAALVDVPHGALADESVIVSRTGRVRVIDLALGAGTVAAMIAGLIPAQGSVAPEVLQGVPPSGAGDVFSIGALMYECLVGSPLERGGPRPSEVVQGVNSQIDDLVARACHKDPDKRFSRPDVLGEVVGEALNRGGATTATAAAEPASLPGPESAFGPGAALSLADEIATQSPAASGNLAVDRVLAAALADTTEKWLISKGKLDYGPFSLADVLKQIESGEIVAGNIIMDKDSGARVDVGEHALLGPMVEVARQRRDDSRRAQAEVAVQSREKKRGAALYAVILLGVLGAAAAVFFIIKAARSGDGEKKIAGIEAIDGASLKVTVTMPKPPAKKPGGSRGGGQRAGGNYQRGTEDLSLDMSGDDDSSNTSTLDMGTVYGVYSRHGGRLGGCLQKTGAGSASIGIIIDGPSGRVTLVKVDGKQSGATWACLNGALRGMQFPKLSGGRTRAEFDIGI